MDLIHKKKKTGVYLVSASPKSEDGNSNVTDKSGNGAAVKTKNAENIQDLSQEEGIICSHHNCKFARISLYM